IVRTDKKMTSGGERGRRKWSLGRKVRRSSPPIRANAVKTGRTGQVLRVGSAGKSVLQAAGDGGSHEPAHGAARPAWAARRRRGCRLHTSPATGDLATTPAPRPAGRR